MLQLSAGGQGTVVRLGTGIAAGMRPQLVVPRGMWQGSRLAPGGRFALMGTTVAPGFDFVDYERGSRKELVRLYPEFEEMICALTRE